MRLLFDTNILIALSRGEVSQLGGAMSAAATSPANEPYASVASLWEVAIKMRLGKLDPARPLDELPDYLDSMSIGLLVIDHRHVLAELDPEPGTRDPFDRLLLAQCQVEGLRLLTLDRALAGHPLAWTAES